MPGIDDRDIASKSALHKILKNDGPDRTGTRTAAHDGDALWREGFL
jgi:hypothetical protein